MRGRLTSAQKWWLVAGIGLAWSTVSEIGLIPGRAVSDELPPVAIGIAAGCVVAPVALAIAGRFRRWPRWIEIRSSLRWRGRPRFVDWLAFLAVYVPAFQLMQWLASHHVAHLGELLLGLLDGVVIVVVATHLARRAVAPPDTSGSA